MIDRWPSSLRLAALALVPPLGSSAVPASFSSPIEPPSPCSFSVRSAPLWLNSVGPRLSTRSQTVFRHPFTQYISPASPAPPGGSCPWGLLQPRPPSRSSQASHPVDPARWGLNAISPRRRGLASSLPAKKNPS